jgi:hypothetical protein
VDKRSDLKFTFWLIVVAIIACIVIAVYVA